MIRHDNWQSRLTDLINKRRSEPYHIIQFNCLKWACEAIETQIELDLYSKFEGKFSTEKGAAMALRNVGRVKTCVEYLEKNLGEKKHLAFVRKGDIVAANVTDMGLIIPTDVKLFGPCLGVCYGRLSYFVGEDGLAEIETMRLGPDSYGFHC